MHEKVLAAPTAECLRYLSQNKILIDFYLGGGTAVALYLGHRQSEDLDFFSAKDFSTLSLRQKLAQQGEFILDEERPGTLHGSFHGVKISLLEYPYPLLNSLQSFQGTPVASLEDLAAMKLDAIASRGKKRDFIDLYALIQEKFSLKEVLDLYKKKYSSLKVNPMHVLKGLTYFEDAEKDPDPKYFQELNWENVKGFFLRETPKLV